ncbi:sulfotransferase family 2 domain-containing protein [Maritimibacter alkaliphilus]|uniref:sulfotransferase family 2 domain-containing protein n=1 Tax=Maritimibacter alkaliphilus TaxID=404236 RepID=UPI001C93F19F|nr:sulfotransferase family 2 domain-containing protein [Maritimibacter alkaliphilus]MBY6092518.1 sulfotransferase family protein [Maritimibacter alkaliphilus]
MHSSKYRFIFIHYPKTGGNTVQSVLLPFSDDQKVVEAHQDGVDRFEVKGPVTPEKHASLQDYSDRLGDDFADQLVLSACRHPFERIVSAYFSPHKWIVRASDGSYVSEEPYWDEKRLETLLKIRYQRPLTEYLTTDKGFHKPDLLIRHENYEETLRGATQRLGIPLSAAERIPRRNASAATQDLKKRILSSKELRDRMESFYSVDMANFGYDSYPIPG